MTPLCTWHPVQKCDVWYKPVVAHFHQVQSCFSEQRYYYHPSLSGCLESSMREAFITELSQSILPLSALSRCNRAFTTSNSFVIGWNSADAMAVGMCLFYFSFLFLPSLPLHGPEMGLRKSPIENVRWTNLSKMNTSQHKSYGIYASIMWTLCTIFNVLPTVTVRGVGAKKLWKDGNDMTVKGGGQRYWLPLQCAQMYSFWALAQFVWCYDVGCIVDSNDRTCQNLSCYLSSSPYHYQSHPDSFFLMQYMLLNVDIFLIIYWLMDGFYFLNFLLTSLFQ